MMIPEFLQYDFMVRALLGGAMSGGLAPILGAFLVLRRVSLIADTLAHVALLGLAIGLVTTVFPTVMTFACVTLGAVIIEQLRSRGKLPSDVALAVVLYGAMATAVALVNSVDGLNVNLYSLLFGSILSLTSLDVWLLAGLAALTVIAMTMFFSELSQVTFDHDLAKVSGVPVEMVNLGLAVFTGATITLAMRSLGVLLVGALIVVPFVAAQTVGTSLRGAIALASLIGMTSAILGVIISFYVGLAPSATVVLSAIGALLVLQGGKYISSR